MQKFNELLIFCCLFHNILVPYFCLVNVSQKKQAAVSSFYGGHNPLDPVKLAICTDGILDQGGCDTKKESPAWLRVDLEKDTMVVGVKVYQVTWVNGRLWEMGVNVGYTQDWNQNDVCLPDVQDMRQPFIELNCTQPVKGRYIHLFREKGGNRVLSVSEFEVYGYYLE